MISITPATFPIERLGWLLIHSIWQFAILALVIAVLLRLLRSAPATVRYWASLLALGIMVIAPVVTFLLLPDINKGTASLAPEAASPSPRSQPVAATSSVIAPSPRPDRLPRPRIEPVDINKDTASKTPLNTERPLTSWLARVRIMIAPWLEVCVAIWGIGVFLFALRPLSSWYRLHRLRRVGVSPVGEDVRRSLAGASQRLGVRKAVRALQSTFARVPLVAGYLRPVILLPAGLATGLPASQLEAILLHELAHVRRHDYLVNLAQTLVETLFFYHPAIWWLSSRIRQERELCCDELAARALGDRAGYGRALLALEELRGTAPVLSLGARGGSLLERIRRLTGAEAPRANPGGLVCSVFLTAVLVGVGVWSVGYAGEDTQPDRKTEKETASEVSEPENASDQSAKELAVRANEKAQRVDELPRFYIRSRAATRAEVVTDEDPQLLKNLKRALDETGEKVLVEYEKTFAWDEDHFFGRVGTRRDNTHDEPEPVDPDDPVWRSIRWGIANLAGSDHQSGKETSLNVFSPYVLRDSAAEMWPDVHALPVYLMSTTHEFWWGDTSDRKLQFDFVPVSASTYRMIGTEEFGGETCYVVESPTRKERLWISRKTGRLRGRLEYLYKKPPQKDVLPEELEEIFGRSFKDRGEFNEWLKSHMDELSREQTWRLTRALRKRRNFEEVQPIDLTRFSDFREVAPGIWWPFREVSVSPSHHEGSPRYLWGIYVVEAVRTDLDLTPIVNAVRPEEGQTIQDQRYAVTVNYKYRADRTTEEILELVDEEYQQRLEGQKVFDRLTKPFDEMVGKPAPALPADGWVGGTRPDVQGKPYLIHLWATWCGPCKNDYPLLKKLADDGALVVGLHPAGTPAEDVIKMIQEYELGYPTFVSDKEGPAKGTGRTIAGYPAGVFPYAVLVDAEGNVVSHGMLRESEGKLLREFRELWQERER